METSPTASCSGSAVHREAGACVVSVQPPVEASLGMDEEQHSLPSCKRHRGQKCRSPTPSPARSPTGVYGQPLLAASDADVSLLVHKADSISRLLNDNKSLQHKQEDQAEKPTEEAGGRVLSSTLSVPSLKLSRARGPLNNVEVEATEDVGKWASGPETETEESRGDIRDARDHYWGLARQQLYSHRISAAEVCIERLANSSQPPGGNEVIQHEAEEAKDAAQQKQEGVKEEVAEVKQGRGLQLETGTKAHAAGTAAARAALAGIAAGAAAAADSQEELESLFKNAAPTYENELGLLSACTKPQTKEMQLARTVVLICLADLRDSCIPEVYIHPMDRQLRQRRVEMHMKHVHECAVMQQIKPYMHLFEVSLALDSLPHKLHPVVQRLYFSALDMHARASESLYFPSYFAGV